MSSDPEQIIARTLGCSYGLSHARRIITKLRAEGYHITPIQPVIPPPELPAPWQAAEGA